MDAFLTETSHALAQSHHDLLPRRNPAMIVVMKPGSTQQQLDHVIHLVREMGLKDHVIVGTERTVVAVVGNDRFKDRTVLETVEGVEKVVPILAPYKMASKEVKKERSLIPLMLPDKARVGGRKVQVRSEEHTSELQSRLHLVCRLLLEKKKKKKKTKNSEQNRKRIT